MSYRQIPPAFLKQDDPTLERHWFQDARSNLSVWLDRDSGRVLLFHLDESADRGDLAVIWSENAPLYTGDVDSGETGPSGMTGAKRSPVITSHAHRDLALLERRRDALIAAPGDIPAAIAAFIVTTLNDALNAASR
jgi:hypothetical protein